MPAMGLKHLVAAMRAHVAHPGPRASTANTIALVIVSNQPFYPLYIYWVVSPVIWPSFLTFLSTPLFALVPTVMRRASRLGRCLLLCAGIGNTLLCRFAFGDASGVEVFLFPCLMLAVLLFDRDEWIYTAGFATLGFAAYLLPVESISGPLHLYEPREYAAMRNLNFLSAASLTVLIGWLAQQSFGVPPDDETGSRQRTYNRRNLRKGHRMRRLLLALIFASLSAAAASTTLDGIWLRDDGNARVRIAPCGDNVCATNLWIGDTSKGEERGDKLIMTLSRQRDGSFAGTAYDPKRGWTFSMTVKAAPGELNTRGCILGRLLCRDVNWKAAD